MLTLALTAPSIDLASPRPSLPAAPRVREGLYRTLEPVPIRGNWKTGVRILNGRMLLGLPIHAPEDRAIPAAA